MLPRGGRSPRITSQLPISSEKPITPALQGQHRQQQNQLGDAGWSIRAVDLCIEHRLRRDQPGLSVPSALLPANRAPELPGKCELVLRSDERAYFRSAYLTPPTSQCLRAEARYALPQPFS
jgi:hypothetical protein